MSSGRENNSSPTAPRHRAYVGSPDAYDKTAAAQFALMIALGLREHHTLLDIGCGSLCGGRLFIPYLLPGNYCAIEPETWLVEDGIRFEVSDELRKLKRPSFRHADDFSLSGFDRSFDFMLAHSVLTHVTQAQLERCLAEARLALKPEGMFAASFYSKGDEVYAGREWLYPSFASYPFKFLVEIARGHGLGAYPLIWSNSYGQYWTVFTHAAYADKVRWLGDFGSEQRMLRVLELTRELNDLRLEHKKLKGELAESEREHQGLENSATASASGRTRSAAKN